MMQKLPNEIVSTSGRRISLEAYEAQFILRERFYLNEAIFGSFQSPGATLPMNFRVEIGDTNKKAIPCLSAAIYRRLPIYLKS
jgi:hypothetical protein